MNDILLISISGEDQPGVTAGVTTILARHGVNVLDIGQAVIHATLSMGMLVEMPDGCDRNEVIAEVQEQAVEQGMILRVNEVGSDSYKQWVEAQGRARYIITLLARKITAHQIARVTEVVSRHKLNIDGSTACPVVFRWASCPP